MARLLDAPSYAALVSLISLVSLAGLPAGAIQAVAARFTAIASAAPLSSTATMPSKTTASNVPTAPSATRAVLTSLLRPLVPTAALLTIALLAGAVPLSHFLRLEDASPLLLLAPTLGLTLLLPVLRGAAQGLHAFGLLAALLLLEAAGKVLGGAALALAGYGTTGAMGAILAGILAAALLGALWLRTRLAIAPQAPETSSTPPTIGARAIWRFSLPSLLATGGLFAMVVLDAVLVKHYFPPEDAATFAALSVTGRSLFWASGAITLVLLPLVARRAAVPASAAIPVAAPALPGARSAAPADRQLLVWSLAIAGALVAAGELLFLLFPAPILTLLFGPAYAPAAPLLPLYGLGAAALSLANVTVYYLLGRGGPSATAAALVTPACAAAQLVALTLWHADLHQVTYILLATDALLLTLTLTIAVMRDS